MNLTFNEREYLLVKKFIGADFKNSVPTWKIRSQTTEKQSEIFFTRKHKLFIIAINITMK